MGPELDLTPKPGALAKASSVKENTSIHRDPERNIWPRASNYRDGNFDREPSSVIQTTKPDRIAEEKSITDVTRSCNAGMVESDGADTVETSSSFGDTESVTEDGLAGDEVQSQLCGEQNLVPDFGGYYDMVRMRNKKLTSHWRRFIRPLMWRCKWMELQMKELQSQALKYDKEIEDYDERKKLELGRATSEDLIADSHTFSSQSQRDKVMKRKRRKRVEETADIGSYMSQHNIFSYYENNKSVPHGASAKVDFGSLGNTTYHNDKFGTSEAFSLESRDEDSSFEALFRHIEMVQSRVRQLISRVDVVVNSAQNPSPTPGNGNGSAIESPCIDSQNTSEKNMGDLLMLNRAVPSHSELTPSSEVKGRSGLFGVGELFANTEEVLIDNEQAKEKLRDFEKFRNRFGKKPQLVEDRNKNPPPVSEANSVPSNANVRTKAKKRKRRTGSGR